MASGRYRLELRLQGTHSFAMITSITTGGRRLQPLSIYDKKSTETPQMRFRGIGDFVPVLLNILLGIQHMGVAFGPVILPAATFAYTFRGVFDDQCT